MADENFEALQAIAENDNAKSSNDKSYPFFLDAAEKIPFELQGFVADYKRKINYELTPDNLLWAVGEEVSNFEIRKGLIMPVLKMRLEENQAPVYVFANQVGSNYPHLDNFLDQRVKIAITNFMDCNTQDNEGNEEYIALGSIQQAEFVVNGVLYQQFLQDPDAVKSKDRIGTITQVIDTSDFEFIAFDYQGVQLGMLAKNFYYQTFTHPLSEVAYIGMKFSFRITDIKKVNYEDQNGIKEHAEKGQVVPKGLMYQVMTTRLPYLTSPDDKVKSLYERGADFRGNIVRYHSIKGIIVEIAPGWWIKGIVSPNSKFQPSAADAKANTPVIVRLQHINLKKRTGRALVIRFPKGVARTADPHNQ